MAKVLPLLIKCQNVTKYFYELYLLEARTPKIEELNEDHKTSFRLLSFLKRVPVLDNQI